MPRRIRVKLGFQQKLEEREILVPDGEPPPYAPNAALQVVGTRVPRVDGPDKVRGAARYTADVQLPGMLHARVLRSPHPAARVAAVDLAGARRVPGVRAALAFVGKEVRYVGEEVAAVAAETPAQAEEALRHIHVQY